MGDKRILAPAVPRLRLLLPMILLLGAMWTTPQLHGQSTSFTYQGQLNLGPTPASGRFDLEFSVHDAREGGQVVAGPVSVLAVPVSNGLFTATIDLPSNPFNGAPRWLGIQVRPATNDLSQPFTLLTPRQPITATPQAHFASVAGTVPPGSITAAQLAPGAAAANLAATGQASVGPGGVILSEQADAPALLAAGFIKMGRAQIVDEAWQPGPAGPAGLGPSPIARRGHTAVWNGSELMVWGGTDDSGVYLGTGARYHPANGTWTPINTTNAPAPRTGHVAVWTGSEMIIWGGLSAGIFGGASVTNTGARYNPATDTWTPITPGGGSRQLATAFWSGTEMIIYGGVANSSGGLFSSGQPPLNSGARYHPGSNTWSFFNASGAPSARFEYGAVLANNELLVWGGRASIGSILSTQTNYNDGARYNLGTHAWSPITAANPPSPRFSHGTAWTGTEMIVWGGRYAEGSVTIVASNLNNGARFNPVANTWTPLATAGAPSPRYDHAFVWTGNRIVAWGGTDGTNTFDTGARYFPAANAWSNLTTVGRPAGRSGYTTTWTGTEIIIWGGFNEVMRDIGGRYHPVNDTWTPTPPSGARPNRRGHTATWTGAELLIWGGFDGESHLNTGGRYRPSTGTWQPIPTEGAPAGRAGHTAVWTGSELVVWGGFGPGLLGTGGRFNPTTGQWTPITTNGAPTPRTGHAATWTGSRVLVWGGFDGAYRNNGSLYLPDTDSWIAMPAAGAPAGRANAAAAWTGSDWIVWGGTGGTVPAPVALNSGARFNPANNSWTALPTVNAPTPRADAQAVWTGSELLVWGGSDGATPVNTGGRYRPAANDWTSLPTNNAPAARTLHTTVWDGSRLIVWGGQGATSFLDDGGIFSPQTDTWQPTLVSTNSPTPRSQQAAAWTGSELVVHGGYRTNASPASTTFLRDTWHYAPPRTVYLYLKP